MADTKKSWSATTFSSSGQFQSPFKFAQLSEKQFKAFSELIYAKTGIFLKPEKKELLNARLGKRLRACRIGSFKEYYEYVMNDKSGEELVHLIDSVSTNFTNFFRESAHFDFLTSTVLPEIINAKNFRNHISIWSAACSSGEEPYTIAMVVDDFLRRFSGIRFEIKATDISTRVLTAARKAVYPQERVKTVPQDFLRRYFQKGVGKSSGHVKVKDNLKGHVNFEHFNLMDDFPWQESFDVVFCRNVMIYFNRQTQTELVEKFYGCLKTGGFFFIGHSESISSIRHNLNQAGATAYRK